MFGLALGIGQSDTSFNPSDEGGLNTSAWNISLYGGLYPEDGLFYADGFVAYGHSSLDSERRIHYVDAERHHRSHGAGVERRKHAERRRLGGS